MESIQAELISILVTVITGCAIAISKYAISFFNKKGKLTQFLNNKEWVNITVNAVEQANKDLKGKEKLGLAKMEIVQLMNEKKIKITEKEIDLMIEAVVKEMNNIIKDIK